MPPAAAMFSQLMKRCRALVAGRISEQSRQSLPVPVPSEGGAPPRIAFLFAPSQALPGVNRIAPPSAVVLLDPTGALLEVRAVTPGDFGQAHEPRGLLGEFRLPPDMTADGYLTERERLFSLYDALFSAWASGEAPGKTPELKSAAREYLRLFERLREPPLTPYYESLGAAWFGWVRATAG